MANLRVGSPNIKDIQKALTGPLPGIAGQIKMAPQPPGSQRTNRWDRPENCREAGVLLLLYPHQTQALAASSGPELHLVLTRRTEYPGAHSGQISLPGGRREPGEALPDTALRETWEEIGVPSESLEIFGALSSLYTPPSNFCIYPFVAFTPSRPVFQLDRKEVAELIEVPLSLLADPAVQKEEIWHFEKFGARRVPFYELFGHQVWGATAMMLSEFLTLLDNQPVR